MPDRELLLRWAHCFSAGLTEDNPADADAKARFWSVSEELYAAIVTEGRARKTMNQYKSGQIERSDFGVKRVGENALPGFREPATIHPPMTPNSGVTISARAGVLWTLEHSIQIVLGHEAATEDELRNAREDLMQFGIALQKAR